MTRRRDPWGSEARGNKTTTQRGYGTAWQKRREQVMRRDKSFCQPCRQAGKLTRAQAVDHIIPKADGGTDDLGNLQAICEACHRDKTATDSGHKVQNRPVIGADGLPIAGDHPWTEK